MLSREEYDDQTLINTWHSLRSRATDAEGEMYSLRDEADDVAGMLASRGYYLPGASGEWSKVGQEIGDERIKRLRAPRGTPPAGGEGA